jgi:hypothetical protein
MIPKARALTAHCTLPGLSLFQVGVGCALLWVVLWHPSSACETLGEVSTRGLGWFLHQCTYSTQCRVRVPFLVTPEAFAPHMLWPPQEGA